MILLTYVKDRTLLTFHIVYVTKYLVGNMYLLHSIQACVSLLHLETVKYDEYFNIFNYN